MSFSKIIIVLFSVILCANTLGEDYPSLKIQVKQQEKDMLSVFKELHQNPELPFQETKTAARVAKVFEDNGYKVHTGIGVTGVVGIMKNGPGPVVLFRSDMDALPIKEETKLDYRSTKTMLNRDGVETPVMHACGHDAHTTWLMAVAKIMADRKDHWSGTLVLVAQPAEELIEGAMAMVNDGLHNVIPKPDYIIAGHVFPFVPVGSVAIGEGAQMAGTDQIDVRIHGVGGHGSMPHLTKDPVVMAAQAVMDYQVVVSRIVNQAKPAVLTVGAIQAGDSNNVIPSQALLKLNLRWFDPQIRQQMIEGIKLATDNVAKLHGVSNDNMPTYTMKGNSRPLINNVELTAVARRAMIDVLGKEKVLDGGEALMGSEDFHMLAGAKSDAKVIWVKVGAGPKDILAQMKKGNMPAFNHNPRFVVEPQSIPIGTLALTAVLHDLLK